METMPNNFLGLDERHSRYDSARFVILPVPYDSAASWMSGSRNGPGAIISASHHLEWFDEELEAECYRCGIATLDAVEPNMAGPEAMHGDLFKLARRIVRDGKFLFGLGGDHSISSALFRAVMTRHKKLSVLQIDAHCDLRDSYHATRYSHACVMRRILELGASLVPVGVRGISPESHRFMKRNRIEAITARQCHTCDDWVSRAIDALGDTVYVTIDIDAFDPAYAPGTGTPEPGGLTTREAFPIVRRLCAECNVVGFELVEVAPGWDPGYTTALNGLRIIQEAITGMAMRNEEITGKHYLDPRTSGQDPVEGQRTD